LPRKSTKNTKEQKGTSSGLSTFALFVALGGNNSSFHRLPRYFGLPGCCQFDILTALMWSLLKEFLGFCRQEKKWWLAPLVVFLIVLGGILIFASSSGIAWALYPFF